MNKVSHFKVGLFVLISIGFGFGILIWIGAAHFLRQTQPYVSFFNESVEGLSPGTEVSYRGVQVGRVTGIGLAPDGRLIRVTLALQPSFKVDHSMAIQLGLKGITGQRYLKIGPAPSDIQKLTPKLPLQAQAAGHPDLSRGVLPDRTGADAGDQKNRIGRYRRAHRGMEEDGSGRRCASLRRGSAADPGQRPPGIFGGSEPSRHPQRKRHAREVAAGVRQSVGDLGSHPPGERSAGGPTCRRCRRTPSPISAKK